MHRQHHPRGPRRARVFPELHHRELEDVRRGPLDGHVARDPFGLESERAVGRVKIRQEPPAPEERAHGFALTRRLHGLFHEARDPRVAVEVRRDETSRLVARDAELLRERAVAHAVNDPEVDRFGRAPLVGGHLVLRLVEDERRRAGMNVTRRGEGVDERRVLREMRKNAELYLRIVCAQDEVPRRRDERSADGASELGADRDVLEVGIARREPPGRGDRLIEPRVDAPRGGVHALRQRVDVRSFELVELAIREDARGQRVPLCERLEDVGVRGPPALRRALSDRKLQVVEENLLELVARSQGEVAARDLLAIGLDVAKLLLDVATDRFERGDVDEDAVCFHRREHAGERHLDVAHEPIEALGSQSRLQALSKRQRDLGVDRGERRGPFEVDFVERRMRRSCLADRVVVAGDADPELALRQFGEAVLGLGIDEVRGDHRVEQGTPERRAGAPQRDAHALQVVPHLRDLRVGEDRSDERAHALPWKLRGAAEVPVRERDVVRSAGVGRERETDELCAHGVFGGRLHGQAHFALLARLTGVALERVAVEHAVVDGWRLVRWVRRFGRAHHLALRALGFSSGFPESVELLDLPAEFELGVDAAELRDVGPAPEELRVLPLDRRVRGERHELERKARVPFVLAQALPKLGSGYPVERRIDAVERFELRQEVGRRLGSDAWNAGHVVAGVARERQEIADLAGGDAEFFAHLLGTVDPVAHRVPEHDALVFVAHELHQVLVGAHDDDAPSLSEGVSGHLRDEIVGLEVGLGEARDVERPDDLFDTRHLLRQVRRGRRPGRLVTSVQSVAERPPGGIHRHREEVRAPLPHHLLEHVDRAQHRVGGFAARIGERRQRVVGAKDVPGQIDEVEDIAGPRLRQARARLVVVRGPSGASHRGSC